MSIWVSVYCQNRIGRINPSDLTAGIRDRLDYFSDLFAKEDPEDVLARLRADEFRADDTSQMLHLHYLEDGPPIVIDRIGNPEEVAAGVQEYLQERFHDRQGEKATQVREHLGKTVESFHFCMKQRHADGMGTPLVYAAAAWLAKRGNALLRVDEQGWMQLDGGEWFILCPE